MNWLEILGWVTLGTVVGFGLCAVLSANDLADNAKDGS